MRNYEQQLPNWRYLQRSSDLKMCRATSRFQTEEDENVSANPPMPPWVGDSACLGVASYLFAVVRTWASFIPASEQAF